MTIIEHDFPPDVAVAVVVDCSPAADGAPDAHELALEAAELFKTGDLAGADAKIAAAREALSRAGTSRVTVRPLDASELAQRAADAAAREVAATEAEAAAVERRALVTKLTEGKATAAETQAAVAQLLGA